MTNIITKMMFTGLVLVSTHLYAENYDFKPGLWETTSSTETIEIDAPPEIKKMMESMSKRPIHTETECIKSLASIFDSDPDDEQACKTNIKRISANKMSFESLCTGTDGTSTSVGEMNLNGKTFTSSIEVTASQSSIKMKMKIVSNGKYLGACD